MKLVDIDEVIEKLNSEHPNGFSAEDFKSACESAPYYCTVDDFVEQNGEDIGDIIHAFMNFIDLAELFGFDEDEDYDDESESDDEDTCDSDYEVDDDEEDDGYLSKFKHLWWTQQSGSMIIYTCSECKQVVDMRYPYCPMCGDQKIDDWI